MFNKITAAALLLASVTLAGCLDENSGPATTEIPVVPEVTMNDLIAANCETVRDAAEAYALENNGEYPVNALQRNLADKQLEDYLPNGAPLADPHSGLIAEPTIGALAYDVGSTGYVALVNSHGVFNGYLITGMGEGYEYVVTIRKEPVD